MHCKLQGLWLRILLALLIGSAALTPTTAQASVIAYDGFSYPAGYFLFDQNGGFGWSTAYITDNAVRSATINTGSLPYGGLAVSGNSTETASSTDGLTYNQRTLGTTLGADGTTTYLSFLIKPTEGINNGTDGSYAGFNLGELFIGKLSSGFYGIETKGGAGQSSSTSAPFQNITAFLVVRITFQAGADKVELFVNPAVGQPLPATPDATKTDLDLGTTNSIEIRADHSVGLDELRLGTTFADVAATAPVPTSALLFQNQATSQIALWFMLGTQVIGSQSIVPTPDVGWNVVGTGDFNQDGKPDMVFQNQTTGKIVIWFMDGPYFLGGVSLAAVPTAGLVVSGVGDMDGDNKPDLVLQDKTTGAMSLWLMDGTDLANILPLTSSLPGYDLKGVADFDFNGTADLLFQDDATGKIVVWYMNRTTLTGVGTFAILPEANWKVCAMADYNGDGRPDLVFQNTTTNQLAFWYLKDFAYIGGDLVNTIPDASYKIVAPR
jgi:hypothetical protein